MYNLLITYVKTPVDATMHSSKNIFKLTFFISYVALKKELGLFQVTLAGVGIILGAGIYALLGVAAGNAGNAVWISFLFSSIVAIFTGLSYAELSSMFKSDSAEYEYVNQAINKFFATFIGLSMIAAAIVAASTVALGFSGYLSSILPFNIFFYAFFIILVMSLINYIGMKETSWFNSVATIIELSGLLIIIFLGFFFLGDVNYLEMPHGFSGVVSSAALVFFAFIGFESIVKLREETKNANKIIPKAIILSIIITSVLYVLVALATVSIVGWETLSTSEAPLATVASIALGSSAAGFVLVIIALFSTGNTILLSLVTASRQVYGMAQQNSLPKFLSKVGKNNTPFYAVWIVMIISLLLALIGDIEFIANLTNVFIFLTFAFVNLSLIILRYKCHNKKRSFKCPANIGEFSIIAFFGLLTSVIMLAFVIYNIVVSLL